MRAMLGGAVLALAVCASAAAEDKKADEKIDAKKLVGKWSPKENQKGGAVVIEFGKDGKLTTTFTGDGKEQKREGTYKIDGNTLSVTLKREDKEATHNLTVTKLTDAELVTKEGNGKEETFVRVKDK